MLNISLKSNSNGMFYWAVWFAKLKANKKKIKELKKNYVYATLI